MRTLTVFLLFSFPFLLGAQQVIMPESSANDHVVIKSAGINASSAYWASPTGLAPYAVAGDWFQDPLEPNATDSHSGLSWSSAMPASFTSALQKLDSTGGSLRVIFIGESAGWLNSFGYTYSGNTAAGQRSYTLWQNIQSVGTKKNVSFGDYADIPLGSGSLGDFDFWLSAAGHSGTGNYTTATGGIYTLFHNASAQSLWAQKAIALNTASTSSSQFVSTYLVSFEDWKINSGSDADYSDLRIAFQLFNPDGTAYSDVPEPATWALVIGLLAGGFVLYRRLTESATVASSAK